ncbi:hypothetical protein AAF712_015359 [Marasmius tenuissimus]|uniref:SWI5-dependent HO expression protein 3 n=1 Tax=Marasmius tenuissimus TaxID=585030 RepID=A0ABR2Z8Q7_9AGAR
MSKQTPCTPTHKRRPLASLRGFQNSPNPKRARITQDNDFQLEGPERRTSAIAAESKVTSLYASGFEDSQMESQVWLESIQNSPPVPAHNIKAQGGDRDQPAEYTAPEDQTLCDIESSPGGNKDASLKSAGAKDVEGYHVIADLKSTIERLESTVAHLETMNKFLQMNKNRAVYARERAERATKEAEEKLAEAQKRYLKAEQGRYEASDRRREIESSLQMLEYEHREELEKVLSDLASAKRDRAACLEDGKTAAATIQQLEVDLGQAQRRASSFENLHEAARKELTKWRDLGDKLGRRLLGASGTPC